MTLLYSIIIPTHNSHSFVTKLLDSIPDRDDTEIIVIDDHSYDFKELQYVIRKQSLSKRIRLFQNKGVRSAGAARNIGLREAKGKWLLFADSDDYFTNNFEKLLDKYKRTTADIIFFRADGNHITHRVHNLNGLLLEVDLDQVRYRHIVPWGKIISNSIIDKFNIRFSEVLVSNDELFSAKIGLFAKKIIIENLDGYYSFERKDSLTTQPHDTSMHDIRMNEVLKKYIFLRDRLGRKRLKQANLSIFSNIKGAISVGGFIYGLRWYIRIRKAGGKLNLAVVARRRINR